MRISTYSIQHPVVTWVLNAMIAFVGLLALEALPLREYPKTELFTISVVTQVPNASPELVENTVTNLLEDRLASVEGLETLTSSSHYGHSTVQLNLKEGTAMNKALAEVKEAIGSAPLPPGARVPKVSRSGQAQGHPFIVLALEGEGWSPGELSHYAHLNLKHALRSLEGVASVEVWGQSYTYNIVLDAHKLYAHGVSAHEVFDALLKSQKSFSAGKFQNQTAITLTSTPEDVEAYENIIIKQVNAHGAGRAEGQPVPDRPIRLRDVAHVALETEKGQTRIHIKGKPAIVVLIHKASDANPLNVAQRLYEHIDILRSNLPGSLRLELVSDETHFIRTSLSNLKQSVLEAVICVIAVVFLFLRSLRATLVPLIAIPISMLGSLVFLQAFGFSINLMTLLGMVLAIGLVVDDAIVVLENIERHIQSGLNAYNAALKGTRQIGFSIVAMTLTLTSIYIPLAFIQGTLGMLFREFAVVLAGSVLVSGVVALTLSPLMSARLLGPKHNKPLLPLLDQWIESLTQGYRSALTGFMAHAAPTLLLLVLIGVASAWLLQRLPQSVVPSEDRNRVGVYVPPIPGKDSDAQEALLEQVHALLPPVPEATSYELLMGHWGASIGYHLKPQEQRRRSAQQIHKTL